MTQALSNFVGGKWINSTAEATIPVVNPGNEEMLCRVPDSSTHDVDQAVTAAENALHEWQMTPPVARARILFKFREQLDLQQKELAALISRDHGKTIEDARAEISRAMDVVEFACGIPQLLKGEHSHNTSRGIDCWSVMQPVGVCAGITPFNFPAMVPLWMFPIALACGNTFILKPSEQDPLAPAQFPDMLKKAGLPDGVFNLVHGSASTVKALMQHQGVRAVSFVGSSEVAGALYQQGAQNGKRVQALGGAKNHAVVMPDADLVQAAEQLAGAAYGSAGERCMAVSVVVAVGDKTADVLMEHLTERVRKLTVGMGATNPDMGPLISRVHRDKVLQLIETGINEGAELKVDGRSHHQEKGWFIGGCLFDRVTRSMEIYRKEIFGPVLCVMRVSSYEDAVTMIREHEYGNGSAIFTGCGKTAQRFCDDSETGMVGINVPIPVPAAWHCFGGWKRSLFGPMHMHGPEGVRFFTRMKTVTARWPHDFDTRNSRQNLTMPVIG